MYDLKEFLTREFKDIFYRELAATAIVVIGAIMLSIVSVSCWTVSFGPMLVSGLFSGGFLVYGIQSIFKLKRFCKCVKITFATLEKYVSLELSIKE